MRALIILLFLLLGMNNVFAYDLVLPKEKKSIVSTNYAFFVGKAKKTETITINDVKVFIASNGAFAHSVKLKDGENRIVMKSNFNTQVYKFYKVPQEKKYKRDLVEFEPRHFIVNDDNTPLRSTPIDFGMNRISHLFKDTNLIIDGEQEDFYRVCLTNNKHAWIAKKSVKSFDGLLEPPRFITTDTQTFKNASILTTEFSQKLPYTIDENDKEIIFKVYNSLVPETSVYTFNIKKPEKYSYTVKSDNGSYVFKVSELPFTEENTLEGLTIVLDPGHGGSERGALGCLGHEEKDINLAIAEKTKELLENHGAKVVMTRECDGNISLDERVKLARENQADIFISIHLNSIPDIEMNVHKNRGTSIYYYNKNSKDLAEVMEHAIVNNLGTRKDGVRTASFAVLRPTDYISVLAEVAYMTNPLDSVLYTKENFPKEVANSISEAVLTYVKNKN